MHAFDIHKILLKNFLCNFTHLYSHNQNSPFSWQVCHHHLLHSVVVTYFVGVVVVLVVVLCSSSSYLFLEYLLSKEFTRRLWRVWVSLQTRKGKEREKEGKGKGDWKELTTDLLFLVSWVAFFLSWQRCKMVSSSSSFTKSSTPMPSFVCCYWISWWENIVLWC